MWLLQYICFCPTTKHYHDSWLGTSCNHCPRHLERSFRVFTSLQWSMSHFSNSIHIRNVHVPLTLSFKYANVWIQYAIHYTFATVCIQHVCNHRLAPSRNRFRFIFTELYGYDIHRWYYVHRWHYLHRYVIPSIDMSYRVIPTPPWCLTAPPLQSFSSPGQPRRGGGLAARRGTRLGGDEGSDRQDHEGAAAGEQSLATRG